MLMSGKEITDNVTTAPSGVGGAVGVPETRMWYVAVVNNNTEKATAEKLAKLGITHYLPIQTEYRIWKNGRKATVNRVVIPAVVFIQCTECERRQIVALPFINRFMPDRAASLSGSPATIPDEQIARLRFMLGQSDTPVTVTTHVFRSGDKVKVIRGSLTGLEGEILADDASKPELIVRIGMLGCARVSIDPINLEPLPRR